MLPTSFGTQISQSLTPKGEGHFSLQFGDDETNNNKNNFARSAYINKKVFAAAIKDDNKVIKSGEPIQKQYSSSNSSDKAGIASWETIDNLTRIL